MRDDSSQAEVEQWARLEGKSEAMAADLVRTSIAASRGRASEHAKFCPRCVSCAAGGAFIAIAVERLLFAN